MSIRTCVICSAITAVLLPPLSALGEAKQVAQPEAVNEKTADEPVVGKETVFDLKEFRLLESKDHANVYNLRRGVYGSCNKRRQKTIKKCPKLKSENPWYGSVTLDYKSSKRGSNTTFHYVVDESEGSGKGYDRLYFDANQNFDLTDDSVVEVMKKPPPGAGSSANAKTRVCFDYLSIELDRGDESGKGKVEVMPRFSIDESRGREHAYFQFAPTVARKGRIRIGSREYDVLLGHTFTIRPRFDLPSTGFYLIPVDSPQKYERWWGADGLKSMRFVDGRWWSFSATRDGDKLTVHPYQGELGVLEIGPGERKLDDLDTLGIRGSLESKETAVPVGDLSKPKTWPDLARRCELPVGDYLPPLVAVRYGSVEADISFSYYANPGRSLRRLHSIKIRKNKPFVWDFSNKPKVIFTRSRGRSVYKPGDQVTISAMLIDPVLDVMIRGLRPVEPPKKKSGDKDDAKGENKKKPKTPARTRPPSLDPTVVITNSSGKEIARGKMPFG